MKTMMRSIVYTKAEVLFILYSNSSFLTYGNATHYTIRKTRNSKLLLAGNLLFHLWPTSSDM
jgi:hypothetical protein